MFRARSPSPTEGTARFIIPASGHEGLHALSLINGEFTFPDLNPDQNPRPGRLRFIRTFTIAPGPTVLPPVVATQVTAKVKRLQRPGDTVTPRRDQEEHLSMYAASHAQIAVSDPTALAVAAPMRGCSQSRPGRSRGSSRA